MEYSTWIDFNNESSPLLPYRYTKSWHMDLLPTFERTSRRSRERRKPLLRYGLIKANISESQIYASMPQKFWECPSTKVRA